MNNFKILIQGPFHENGLNYINHYRQYCDTLISTWDSPDINKISQYSYISSPLVKPTCFNRGNIYLQTLSTLNGLNLIDSEYVIKLRFDEYFTNLKPIFDAVLRYPEKIVCSNIMISKHYPLTMSDHIIACKTDLLRNTFTKVKELCERNEDTNELLTGDHFDLNFDKTITEAIIFTSYLKCKGINPDFRNRKQLWEDNLYIVDISQLGDFQVRCNTNNMIFKTCKKVLAHSDGIRSIEDLC